MSLEGEDASPLVRPYVRTCIANVHCGAHMLGALLWAFMLHPSSFWQRLFRPWTTWSLAPRAAAMLNLTEDHLDRYASLDDYGAAKARVFQNTGVQVLNRDDSRSLAMALPGRKVVTFGLDAPRGDDFGVAGNKLVQGRSEIVAVDELAIRG